MPDVYIARHGDRWAVKDAPDATPIFESYTREDAESDARSRADGGKVHWLDSDDAGAGDEAAAGPRDEADREDDGGTSRASLDPPGAPERPGETFRETQAGF